MKTILFSFIFLTISITNGISQTVEQIIQTKIEAGIEAKKITADGVVLFSQKVLPAFYEDNSYKPAWKKKSETKAGQLREPGHNPVLSPRLHYLQLVFRFPIFPISLQVS